MTLHDDPSRPFGPLPDVAPYAWGRAAKGAWLVPQLRALTAWHAERCPPFRRILEATGADPSAIATPADVPVLPVRLFKLLSLRSVPASAVVKTMTSSGTTGQQPSRIELDADTAALQTKVLSRIVGAHLGTARLPMLIIDAPDVVTDRARFSARGAGILGFSLFGRDRTYALDRDLQLDLPAVEAFAARHAGAPVLLFGFTFLVWQQFCEALRARGLRLPLDGGILIHGGGWKRLAATAVTREAFRDGVRAACGITRVHDYYGMVEQTGSLHMECEAGFLHPSIYGDVIIRRPSDLREAAVGEPGIIQVLSMLPRSYPGHSLLTEDAGTLAGEDNCRCGRLGKYFTIAGRLPAAELRGCSDVLAA